MCLRVKSSGKFRVIINLKPPKQVGYVQELSYGKYLHSQTPVTNWGVYEVPGYKGCIFPICQQHQQFEVRHPKEAGHIPFSILCAALQTGFGSLHLQDSGRSYFPPQDQGNVQLVLGVYSRNYLSLLLEWNISCEKSSLFLTQLHLWATSGLRGTKGSAPRRRTSQS